MLKLFVKSGVRLVFDNLDFLYLQVPGVDEAICALGLMDNCPDDDDDDDESDNRWGDDASYDAMHQTNLHLVAAAVAKEVDNRNLEETRLIIAKAMVELWPEKLRCPECYNYAVLAKATGLELPKHSLEENCSYCQYRLFIANTDDESMYR